MANGDAGIVHHVGAVTWLAVVDGLGHGPRAANASGLAVKTIAAADDDVPLGMVVDRVDAALQGTRGAGAMICRIVGDLLEGCSVGNVEIRSSHGTLPLLLTPGILGSRVPRLRLFQHRLQPGCRLLLYSDGISRAASLRDVARLELGPACRALLDEHRNPRDDATVLIAQAVP